MRRHHGSAWALGTLLCTGVPAGAQTPAVALPVAHCAIHDATVIPKLTSAYQAGDAEGFEHAAAMVITFVHQCANDSVEEADRALLETLDLGSDYVVLAWPALDQFSEWTLYSAIVHRGADLYGRRLAGIQRGGKSRFFQILVAPSVVDRLAGVYVSDPERHPLVAQLPAVAAAVANPLLAALAAQQGTIADRRALSAEAMSPGAVPASWASVARVDLPFRRASIQVELRASVAPAAGAVERQAEALRSRLAFLEVAHVPCATGFAAQLAAVVGSLAGTCSGHPGECLESANVQFTSLYEAQAPLCKGQSATETTRNLQGLQRVDGAFRKYVSELDATVIPASLRLENVPPTRFGLGLLTGYVVSARTKAVRVRSANGVISPDPPGRQLSMVVVNGAFRSYDPGRVSPGWSERIRWFAGAVVAPDMGAGGGLSFLVVRGLALNAGALVLAVRTPAGGETLGRPPVNAADPFAVGAVRGGFVGVSYNFK
jgi:hypothetical protein